MAEFLVIVLCVSIFVGWIVGVISLIFSERLAAGFVVLILGTSFFAWALSRQPPCAQYETRMQYDPALKMTRTMRVCVERGVWVDG